MPKLTKEQKKKLHEFEPALHRAVKRGDYQSAKKVAFDIQKLLRPTGHETRLMKSKNLLFEAAMESGELDTAMSGFIGVRNKTSKQTRVHLEATTLLAVCYLRKNELKKAEPLISFVIDHKKNIISISKRREFITKIIQRFEEEGAFASLENSGCDQLSPQGLEEEAGKLVMSMSEDEIFTEIGKTTPARTKEYILSIDDFARKQLTSGELKFLPDTQERKNNHKVGKTVFSSFKRVL